MAYIRIAPLIGSPLLSNGNLAFAIISLNLVQRHTHTIAAPSMFSKEVVTCKSGVCELMNSLCFYHDFEGTGFVIWKMIEFGDTKSLTQLHKFCFHISRRTFKVATSVSIYMRMVIHKC